MAVELAGPFAEVLRAAAIGPASRLCCALSGGVDSVVTLDLLTRLQPRFGFTLTAVHVHHGLSPHADAWAQFCAQLCAARGLTLAIRRVEVPTDTGQGLESAARARRHAELVAQPCDWLVFGHHQDDQAETVLFRLFRGSGLRGLGAMAAVEPGQHAMPGKLRPLLDIGRAGIVAYARAAGLEWIEDESNADCRFTRNALRHKVLPVVQAQFPAVAPTLARTAALLREGADLLDDLARLDENACGGPVLAADVFASLPAARAANLLRWQTARMGARAPSRARLGETLRQLREAPGPLRLPLGDLWCCAYQGRVWLERDDEAPLRAHLWCGEPSLGWGAGQVRLSQGGGGAALRVAAGEAMLARPAPGLRMRLGPARPTRSFKNLCQEAGIPPWLRPRLPVLWVAGEPAWIGGIGIAAQFQCAEGEQGVVPAWVPASAAQQGQHLGQFDR
ncbi:putative tRNA(Ile)-lysidine synthetase [Azoarcus olearius]|uniref:tRNA lysidine(34) synthetase TilS n=1 Tax=Azoarcus sp. (strain BH72) TaxID=418699 RepID=UPI0008060818|nr:tRNA lysidine(34) synthetase TilS [Azoarcus olearius]ANQ84055.1 putative tRNA(Ile)-lysidine synthetase [Azoarcus olearius]